MDTVTLKDQAFSSILQGIVSGEYKADSMITEKELCAKLQMSKSPVREALVELCSQHILRSIPRHGYAVVRYTAQNIADIVQYRKMVECGCLKDCFDRITPAQLCNLSDLVEHEFNYLKNKDTVDYWNDTLNFHLTLVSFSGNEFIYNQLKAALTTSMRAYLQFYWEKWADPSFLQPSELHRKIIQAIRAGDRDAAVRYLEEDVGMIFFFQKYNDNGAGAALPGGEDDGQPLPGGK